MIKQQHVSKSGLANIDREMLDKVLNLVGANSTQEMAVKCSLANLKIPEERRREEIPSKTTTSQDGSETCSVKCSSSQCQVDQDILAPMARAMPSLDQDNEQYPREVPVETMSQQQSSKVSRLSDSESKTGEKASLMAKVPEPRFSNFSPATKSSIDESWTDDYY